MKIKTRLRLNMLATGVIAMALGLVLAWLDWRSRQWHIQGENAQAIAEAVYSQRTLTLEYVLVPHPRVLKQWRVTHGDVTAKLRRIGVGNDDAHLFVAELHEDHATVNMLFQHLTALVEGSDAGNSERREGRLIVVGQLLAKTQAMTSNALQLVRAAQERVFLNQQIAAIAVMVLIAGLAAVAIIGARQLTRSIEVPLRRLTAGAELISAGDLNHRINLRVADEIGEVGAAFDDMAENLRLAQGRQAQAEGGLRAVNDKLTTTLADLRNTQQQVIQSEKLAAVGILAAGLAHELNNPLMGVMGYVSFMGKTVQEPEQKKMLARASRELERMRDLIRNTLDFAQPNVEDALYEVRVPEAIERALTLMGADFTQRGISVATHVARELPPVLATVDRMQQLFVNLLMNARDALEDCPEKRIHITAHGSDGQTVVQIADSGPGIPASIQGRIFDPFFTTKPPGGGTGLGLAVARSIVTDLGGSITCDSREGAGATFTITLPPPLGGVELAGADAVPTGETRG